MADKVADKLVAKSSAKTPAKEPAKKRVGGAEFIREVRAELNKVTWPSRKETTVTTVMVFVMVIAAAVFFLTVDWALSHLVQFVITGGI